MFDASMLKQFAEYGILGTTLGAMVVCIMLILRWLAKHAVTPMVKAAIGYLNQQTEATRQNLESLQQLALLERSIRSAIVDMREESDRSSEYLRDAHRDPDSALSTVHTNASIVLLAKAVQRVALAVDVDVTELINEIEKSVSKQRK